MNHVDNSHQVETDYNTFDNLIGCELSRGEIRDFNTFQNWLKESLRNLSKTQGHYSAHIGTEQVIIKSAYDPLDPERKVPHIIINSDGLVETKYTITGKGLKKELLLPNEITPSIEFLRGSDAGSILEYLKTNLSFN